MTEPIEAQREDALQALEAQAVTYGNAKAALERARADLYAGIRDARRLGISLRVIAAAAGVSNPLIQQITTEAPDA